MKKYILLSLIPAAVALGLIYYFFFGSSVSSLAGHWSYFVKDEEGYSTGFDMELTQNENKISGEYSAVWSFPKSEAARINTGTISGTIRPNGLEADISWTGDRGETGTATISFLPEKTTVMLWKRNSVVGGDEFTFDEEMIFWRGK